MKKTQIDRAIEALESKKTDLAMKFNAEAGALDSAIRELRAQQRKPRGPRVVASAKDERAS